MRGKYVLTGGPGSGKSTLIRRLAEIGFYTGAEVPRLLIKRLLKENSPHLPWLDRTGFELLVLEDKVADYLKAPPDRITFFDRGLPDSIGYMTMDGAPIPDKMRDAALNYRYEGIFILPPWEEIYVNDAERKEDFSKAERIYGFVGQVYRDYGYDLIIIPKSPVDDRLSFILSHIGLNMH